MTSAESPNSLADILDRLALAAQSLMDSDAPIDRDGDCWLCCLNTEQEAHDADCGWLIARTTIAPSDLDAVRRLARAIRYAR